MYALSVTCILLTLGVVASSTNLNIKSLMFNLTLDSPSIINSVRIYIDEKESQDLQNAFIQVMDMRIRLLAPASNYNQSTTGQCDVPSMDSITMTRNVTYNTFNCNSNIPFQIVEIYYTRPTDLAENVKFTMYEVQVYGSKPELDADADLRSPIITNQLSPQKAPEQKAPVQTAPVLKPTTTTPISDEELKIVTNICEKTITIGILPVIFITVIVILSVFILIIGVFYGPAY